MYYDDIRLCIIIEPGDKIIKYRIRSVKKKQKKKVCDKLLALEII